jgi:hypothetical protein
MKMPPTRSAGTVWTRHALINWGHACINAVFGAKPQRIFLLLAGRVGMRLHRHEVPLNEEQEPPLGRRARFGRGTTHEVGTSRDSKTSRARLLRQAYFYSYSHLDA